MNRRLGSSGSVDPSVGPVVGELVHWVERFGGGSGASVSPVGRCWLRWWVGGSGGSRFSGSVGGSGGGSVDPVVR